MKRTVLLFSLIFNIFTVNATTYYVSSSGSDLANGISESTAWRTITKVNSQFSLFKPGDVVLFRRGDTFYGTLNLNTSGIPGSPIRIGAYGSGINPVISGLSTLTGWTNQGGGIYSKTVSCESPANIVLVDGVQYGIGRYPNDNWLTYESFSTNTSITDNELGSSVNWSGAEAVIRKNPYVIDRCVITSHSGNTLYYKSLSSETNGTKNYGYFIQNDRRTLDKFGEWYYDKTSSTFYIYMGIKDPNNHSIQISSKDNVLTSTNGSYITIENITFLGSSKSALELQGCKNFSILSCLIDFSGLAAIESRWETSSDLKVDNCHINHSNAIAIQYDGINGIITNNLIENTGLIIGAAYGSLSSSSGIRLYNSTNSLVENNRIINTAYNGIVPGGDNIQIINNYIESFCHSRIDGAGIYTSMYGHPYTGIIMDGNIIVNGIGSLLGTPLTSTSWDGAEGIFLDATSANITIRNNTVSNCNSGIKLHEVHDIIVENNTLYNNRWGFFIPYFGSFPDFKIRNLTINNNTVIAKEKEQLVLFHYSILDDLDEFGTADNNCYSRPVDDNNVFYTREPATGYVYRTLEGWKSYTKQDNNSYKAPVSVSSSTSLRFEYNATKQLKTITLNEPMIDVRGTKYNSSITLQPYSSVILIVDPEPLPNNPVYLSSVIENSTPEILEMTYNIPLFELAPPSSAFNVMADSSLKTIKAVSVSGSKVILTLNSPVKYGEKITVAYTIPSINPLKSTLNYWAPDLSPQQVTNNVTDELPNPVYVSSVIENATPKILEITYNKELAELPPPVTAFSVMVNSSSRSVSSVNISGYKVFLTLASPVSYGDNVTVAYTIPSVNPIKSTLNYWTANLSPQQVANNVTNDEIPNPVYVSSVIENATPNILEITYNKELAELPPPVTAFSVMVNSYSRSVSSVNISGYKVFLTLASPVSYGDNVTVAYTIPSVNPIKSTLNYWTANLSPKQVVNNVYLNSKGFSQAMSPVISISLQKDKDYYYPSPVLLDLDIYDPENLLENIELYNGTTKITDFIPTPFSSYTINDLNPGKHVITAKGIHNKKIISTSKPIEIYVKSVESTDDILNIYPNPCKGNLIVDFRNPLQNEIWEITVLDLTGRHLFKDIVHNDQEEIRNLDLTHLTSGVYLLIIKSNNLTLKEKIIIRKN